MKNLKFYADEGIISIDETGSETWGTVWYCTDGISTFFGETKEEAAANFGVAVGEF